MESENLAIELRNPTLEEYQLLRGSTDWNTLGDNTVAEGIENTLFSVCALRDGEIIGNGRVVGDGAIYFYIQDVIVLPEFRGQGVGGLIMGKIMEYLERNAHANSFIGLMAAEGARDFYLRYGFKVRGEEKPGMCRCWK